MKISELMQHLRTVQDLHGDIEVRVSDDECPRDPNPFEYEAEFLDVRGEDGEEKWFVL